ncbi:hypothetical protein GGR58DRAFT_452165 [Xylaria digitata]|nr:hypothetical protein GGR58DRAFT_452165 [Xylaria digitata]
MAWRSWTVLGVILRILGSRWPEGQRNITLSLALQGLPCGNLVYPGELSTCLNNPIIFCTNDLMQIIIARYMMCLDCLCVRQCHNQLPRSLWDKESPCI